MLFFVDNIYRYTLAGTEVSSRCWAACPRRGLPADAGAEEMGRLQRAHHLHQGRHSITSIQAVYAGR